MKDFIVLKILDIFKVFFQKIGIDYDVMRKIIQIKLIMDGRRVPTIMNNSRKRKNENESTDKNFFFISLIIYFFIGILLIPFMLMGTNYIFQMSIVFGILIFFLMTTLISDFSSVFLDIRDKNIIFSKPIESKTLSAAKFIHILFYMVSISFSLSALGAISALIKNGVVFFLIFLVEIALVDIFVVVLTALIYLFILKFFDGEKLKDIINYVQIILTMVITVGYQLIIRMFNIVGINAVYSPKWWQYFIIPTWFAAPYEMVFKNNFNINIVILCALAIIVPIITIIIYIKFLPSFERNLRKLDNNNAESKKDNSKLTIKVSNVICKSKVEKIFFKFCSDMIKNERDFKLKVYPSLGFAIIFPFIFLFNEFQERGLNGVASSKLYFTIYFCALMLPLVVMMLKYSAKYKGAWIYKAVPLSETSDIYRGSFKALLFNLVFPVYFIESLIFIGIFGIRIFPDLILIFLNMLFYMVICFQFQKKALPFSEPYGNSNQGEGLIIIPMMFLLGALAGLHFFVITIFGFGIYIYIVIMVLVNLLVWRNAFKLKF